MILFILITSCSAFAKHLYLESEYQKAWCESHNGITEYKLKDNTRVDCLTPELAVEFDFAPKWAECVGQAIYYGRQTNRRGACVLIMEKGDADLKYLYRLRRSAYKKGVGLKTFTISPKQLVKSN